MIESNTVTIERSERFIYDLVQSRAETGWDGVTVSDIIGMLAVPTLLYDPRGEVTQLITIAGGAASGKSTLAEDMAHALADNGTLAAIISSDDFVRWDRGERHRQEAAGAPPEDKYDFFEMRQVIGAICANQNPTRIVEAPKYDPHTGLAIDSKYRQHIPRVDVLIVEGDMLGEQGMSPQALCPNYVFNPSMLYVHAPDEVRLARRIARDMLQRNAQGAKPQDIADSFEHRQVRQHFPYTLQYALAADVILTPPINRSSHGSQVYDMYAM